MRSLNSICRARDEARYISRTWSSSKPVEPVEAPAKITEEWTKADTAKWGSIDAYNDWYAENERRKEAKIPNLIKFAQALNELPERRRCCPLWGKFPNDHAKILELMYAEPSRFNAKVVYEIENFEELFV
jgi:hypothetical protein